MRDDGLETLWVYLSASPMLGLTITLVAYSFAYWVYVRGRQSPLLNPVVVAVALLIGLLLLTGTSYDTYFEGAQFVHFLLGPATVALAVPLYQQFPKLKRLFLPILLAVVSGITVGAVSAVMIVRLLGGSLAQGLGGFVHLQ